MCLQVSGPCIRWGGGGGGRSKIVSLPSVMIRGESLPSVRSDEFLSQQVIHDGRTVRCHPEVVVPIGRDI